MPHSASRVLCTPVFRSFKSRRWLKAQMTDLRSAEVCSSSCLMRSKSGAHGAKDLMVDVGISLFGMAVTSRTRSKNRNLSYSATQRWPGTHRGGHDCNQV